MGKVWITSTHYNQESTDDVVVCPLLKIEHIVYSIGSNDYMSLIATSSHALHNVTRESFPKLQKIYTVGDTAFSIARSIFNLSVNNYENVDALMMSLDSSLSPVLYLRGEDISKDIRNILSFRSIKVEEIVAYRAVAINELPSHILDMLKRGSISEIRVYSRRGYEALMRFAKNIKDINIVFVPEILKLKCLSIT